MRTRLLIPALVATTVLMTGSAAMAATATTIPPANTVATPAKTVATPAKTVATTAATTVKATPAKTSSTMAKVDVNTASVTALRKLPGVGPKLAQEIVSGRPYKDAAVLQKRLDKYLSNSAATKLETHFSY